MRTFGPASLSALTTLVLLAGLTGCSRTDDRAGAPAASGPAATPAELAPVAGGPTTLKPGAWKTVSQTPAGPEETTQCVGEAYDPGAAAAAKATPCGKPNVVRTADGFQLDQSCKKDNITYEVAGTVRGDFVTTATTDLSLTLSAFGRKQTMRMTAVSTYLGPCRPDEPVAPPAS